MLKKADVRYLRGASVFYGVQGLMGLALVHGIRGEFILSAIS